MSQIGNGKLSFVVVELGFGSDLFPTAISTTFFLLSTVNFFGVYECVCSMHAHKIQRTTLGVIP